MGRDHEVSGGWDEPRARSRKILFPLAHSCSGLLPRMHVWPYLLTPAWSRSQWAVAGHSTENLDLYQLPTFLPVLSHKQLCYALSVTLGTHSDTQSILMGARQQPHNCETVKLLHAGPPLVSRTNLSYPKVKLRAKSLLTTGS